MVARIESDVPSPSPKLSDKPVKATLLSHLGLLVLFTPMSMALFTEVSFAHQLYIAFLASGLMAFGTLLAAMLLHPLMPALRGIKPAQAEQEEAIPAGRLAAAA